MTAYNWKDGEPTEETQNKIDSGHHDFDTMSKLVQSGKLIPVGPATHPGQVFEAVWDDENRFVLPLEGYWLDELHYVKGVMDLPMLAGGRYLSCGTPKPSLWQRFARWWRNR